MEKRKKSAAIDMTQGSALRLLLVFSLPMIAGNALQQLYNMVDSIVVGRFVSHTALAAVGAAFPVIFMVSSMFLGLGMGAMVMVSQYFGGAEAGHLQSTIDTVYTALLVGAVPLSILSALLTGPILSLVDMPADAYDEGYIYMVIVLGGLLGSLGYNLNAGILQGMGDSRTPLLFLVIATVINIALDLFLVLVVPLGAAGVAIATVVAQFFSWVFGIVYINKKYPQIHIRLFSFKFSKSIFWQILRLGVPAGVQQGLIGFAAVAIQRLVNSFGSIYAAGFSASNKLDTFAFLPIQSVSSAATTFVGQNIGAGRLDRVKSGVHASIGLCTAFSLLGLLVIPAGPTLMRLFSSDPEVIAAGMAFIVRIMPCYWVLGIHFTIMNVIRGAGESLIPMIAAIISLWLARVPAAFLLAQYTGRDNMHFGYVIGWLVGMCITVPYYLSGRWKNKALTRAGSNVKTGGAQGS